MEIDIIGDVHGCFREFEELTQKLNYQWIDGIPIHPNGRKLAFLGDITDRGPNSIKMIEVTCRLVSEKLAYYTPGNHCNKLYRYFLGNKVQISHGLETTVDEYQNLDSKQQREIQRMFLKLYESSPLYLILDDGNLIIAHAGIPEHFIGKYTKEVKTFVLYGDITGEKLPDGRPVRRDWAKHYHGQAIIVYGHTPVKDVRIKNRTYNIDTGAVFGGKLTALRYPEMEIVQVRSTMPLVEEKFCRFS